MKLFKDSLGQELQIGDTVVCVAAYYHEIAIAKITKICPVKIKVKSIKDNGEWFVYPEGIVKINNLIPRPVREEKTNIQYNENNDIVGFNTTFKCPNCNKIQNKGIKTKFCPECGKALIWEEQ